MRLRTHYPFSLQWDEALLTMSAGEKAEITIEPEWAYGKKGIEGKYPFSKFMQRKDRIALRPK